MNLQESKGSKKPFLGIQFECCDVYSRIYKKPEADKYEGRCPKCLRLISVRVDSKKGTHNRFFRAL